MPRMDGLTLIENLRREEKYKTCPILVISSLENQQQKDKLETLKVDGIIIKGQFDRSNLLNAARRLIG